MRINLVLLVVILHIKRNRLVLQVHLTWCVGQQVFNLRITCRCAEAIAEISDLVHVQPESIKGQLGVERVQLVLPPLQSVWMLEVREYCLVWPHLAYEYLVVCLQKDVFLYSLVIS